MTEAEDTTERRMKRLRYSARALAVTWALGVTFCWFVGLMVPSLGCGASFGETHAEYGLPAWLITAAVVLAPWIGVATVWRWERAGAVVVLFLCVLVPIAHLTRVPVGTRYTMSVFPTWTDDVGPCESLGLACYWLPCVVLTALLGLLAALLLLVSWWKSRTLTSRQTSE